MAVRGFLLGSLELTSFVVMGLAKSSDPLGEEKGGGGRGGRGGGKGNQLLVVSGSPFHVLFGFVVNSFPVGLCFNVVGSWRLEKLHFFFRCSLFLLATPGLKLEVNIFVP